MSKINQIQNALREMDGGAFQKLADSYIHRKGYQNINAIGSVIGADKVRKGTPDSYSRQENGKLIFAEYTTDKSDTAKKLKGDLEKCLDSNKTGVSLEDIDEILFCHNSKLSLDDEQELYNLCKKNEIKIQIFGIEGISFDLYQKYPSLAQDFLGVDVDTGQILEPTEFVKAADKNQISTPLDTNFHGRDDELQQVLEKMEANELLILSGSAGVGKSRLAIEALREYKITHPNYDLRIIHNKGIDVFEDIRAYFSSPGHFLILVDDANRITQFDYVVDLIQNQRFDQNIKVIATVRDYARDKVLNSARPLASVSEVELQPMALEKIRGLVEDQFNITNPIYLDRIADIAGGNPRLAVMASLLAVKENTLESIRDVSALYDEYYASIFSDLKNLENSNVLKIAGIVSFFRHIDKSNNDVMQSIKSVFGITPDDFWAGVEYLHSMEVVDVYEKEVVKISDQVFSTYLFYLCFFKEDMLQFSQLLDNYFPSHVDKLRDALYPCFNSFDFDYIASKIKSKVISIWDYHSRNGNTADLHQLIKTFWFLLESKVLIYVRNEISELAEQPFDAATANFETNNVSLSSHPLLEILTLFRQASDSNIFELALDLTCKYIKKKPCSAPQFVKIMIDSYGFGRHSHQSDYLIQRTVVSTLWKETKEGENELFSRLFVEVVSNYLKTQFDSHEGGKSTITIYKFKLLASESIFSMRAQIWQGLFQLYKKPVLSDHVYKAIRKYCESGYFLTENEIIENDANCLIPFIKNIFDPENFSECLLVQKYNKLLMRRDIDLAEEISGKYFSDTYQLYALLAFDYSDAEVDAIQEFDKIKKDRIFSYVEKCGFDDCQKIIGRTGDILSLLNDSRETYQIVNAIYQIFVCIGDKDLVLYEDVVRDYLGKGNTLNLYQPMAIIKKLLDACGAENALHILKKTDYAHKKHWLFDYYRCLPAKEVTLNAANELLSLYEGAEPREVPYDFDFLLSYSKADPKIIAKVISLIIAKYKVNAEYGRSLDLLFNIHSDVNKRLFQLLEDDISIIKESYLIHCKSDVHADYNGSTLSRILSLDPNFILEIIEHVYKDDDWPSEYSDSRDYSFIWEHGNYKAILSLAIDDVLRRELERGYISGSYLEKLFCVDDNKKTSESIESKQDEFLKKIIAENTSDANLMELIFEIVCEFRLDRRKQFVEKYLDHNKSYQEFEKLSLEPNHWGCTGSAVPMWQKRVDYWESLLPLCGTVELLDHKLLIERNISDYRHRVERAKKSDFIEELE